MSETIIDAVSTQTPRDEWVFLERGPTQNAGYVLGGCPVFAVLFGSVLRVFKGLAFDIPYVFFAIKVIAFGVIVALLSAFYLKSWKVQYNRNEIITQRYQTLSKKPIVYFIKDIQQIGCYFSRSVIMFGLPFDTLYLDFQSKRLAFRTSDWKRDSLKSFIFNLMSVRDDLSRDPRLLNYAAGEYDDVFTERR